MGLFIVFEGGEGSGKSTQVKRLAGRLNDGLHEVISTYEPGGTTLGEQLRKALIRQRDIPLDPAAELFLFGAARAQLTLEVLLPALTRGATVVCDRFAASSVAYQGYGRGLHLDTIRAVNEAATHGLVPDIVFLLDVPPGQALRRKKRSHDRFELEDHGFHERVRAGYRALAAKDPGRWVILDGGRTADEISEAIWAHVVGKLG